MRRPKMTDAKVSKTAGSVALNGRRFLVFILFSFFRFTPYHRNGDALSDIEEGRTILFLLVFVVVGVVYFVLDFL